MEMSSSTRRFDADAPLTGCGVDVEATTRFLWVAESETPVLPFVFSQREWLHARHQADPTRALCISFSCKEALRKALGRPFNFTECEVFPETTDETRDWEGCLQLASTKEFKGLRASAHAFLNPLSREEMVTAVFLSEEKAP